MMTGDGMKRNIDANLDISGEYSEAPNRYLISAQFSRD
jgi:hypothetical protein